MKYSPEIEVYRKEILEGKKGLMPITSNDIEIVWVHPCGYGRKVILSVDLEGKKQFEAIMKECKNQYDKNDTKLEKKEPPKIKLDSPNMDIQREINRPKGCGKDIPTGVPPFKWSCTRPCGSDPKQLCDDCLKLEQSETDESQIKKELHKDYGK